MGKNGQRDMANKRRESDSYIENKSNRKKMKRLQNA